MPNWLIDKLGVPINGTVVVRNVSLPKAAFAKLRPHKTEFIELSNPKAVLEIGLRTLSCITKNDKIKVEFNNQVYFLDVLEIKNPAGQDCEAADLRETDLRTDFAPPLDYEEVQYIYLFYSFPFFSLHLLYIFLLAVERSIHIL